MKNTKLRICWSIGTDGILQASAYKGLHFVGQPVLRYNVSEAVGMIVMRALETAKSVTITGVMQV